jgi:RNA polymerase sigma-70 factor (ECF subfamily)
MPAARLPDVRHDRVSSPERNDAEITAWALAAGGGDRKAAELFVRATYDDVRRFVIHLTADVSAAEDIAQETYLRALPSLSRFRARSCARSWLLAIARRVIVDGYRRAAARPRIAEAANWHEAADRAQPRDLPGFEEAIALLDALAVMAPERQQAFVLTQLLGWTYAEAARAAGCPVGTVRSRVARARDELTLWWKAGDTAVASPTRPPAEATRRSSRQHVAG